MRKIYTALFYLLLPFILLRLLWRSRLLPGYRDRFKERFGFGPSFEKCIWIHAVSVGETIAAIPLIKELKKEYPEYPFVVTNMTPTGAARAKAALGDSVVQMFIPYDLPGAVSRFLDRVHPLVSVVMETELWPNLFAACRKRKIPIILANARLSEKSYKGYKAIRSMTYDMLDCIRTLAAQARADADRFIALGIAPDKIAITGNLKFDLEIPPDLVLKSEHLREQLGRDRLIWIAASTHPSEEEVILAAHRAILKKYPEALLILVPRHPDRFDSVATLCEKQGFTITRRSERLPKIKEDATIYLGDSMGELLLLYSVADVALVAGSFAAVGGHNMLEPAVLQKPILTGPQLFNFADISQMLINAKGMFVVQDADALSNYVIKFFADRPFRLSTGEYAYQVIAENRGSLKKQIHLVKACL